MGGPLLADHRQLIQRLAADALKGGDGIGADTLVGLRMNRAQTQVVAIDHLGLIVAGMAVVGHHFGTAGHHQVFHPGHQGSRRQADRGNTRATVSVQSDAAGADIVAGIQCRHAPQITALLASLGTGR